MSRGGGKKVDPWVSPVMIYDEIGKNEHRGRKNWTQQFGGKYRFDVSNPPRCAAYTSLFSELPDSEIDKIRAEEHRLTRAAYGLPAHEPSRSQRKSSGRSHRSHHSRPRTSGAGTMPPSGMPPPM